MPTPKQVDPTGTGLLTRQFLTKLRVVFRLLQRDIRQLIEVEDAFGLKPKSHNPFTTNTRWQFTTDPEKLKAFQAWLKGKLQSYLRSKTLDDLWMAYIQDGFRKGAGKAFDDTKQEEGKKPDPSIKSPKLDFYAGTKMEFMRSAFGAPEALDKVKLLAARTYDGMDGISAKVATQMSRFLTDGLVQGQNPRTIAKQLTDKLGIEARRAETIARTEIIRAHAEGQLLAFEKLGVEEVGAAVEWSTAGDGRVCPLCRPLQGVVLTLDEAKGMIPRHPNCRCAWIPANVGEKAPSKMNTKKRIQAAVEKSARLGKDEFSTAVPVSKQRPESIL